MTGGRIFLTHPMRLVGDHEPLWATRSAALELFGLDCNLKLPMPPAQTEMPNPSAPYVVVHPGASQQLRQMSTAQMNVVLEKIPKNTSRLIVASGLNELNLQKKCMDYFSGRGFYVESWVGGLPDFVRLCGQSEAVFTMDSGPAHLAAWSGSRTDVFCNHDSPNIVAPLQYC
jgi:ADP-heptose:LPS heptosyltransferase